MARRTTPRNGRRRASSTERPLSLGSHWRSDGTPKTAYPTQSHALSVADEQRLDFGIDLSVYQCEYCSSWHMGNAAGRES
jgi:hypothetical protein